MSRREEAIDHALALALALVVAALFVIAVIGSVISGCGGTWQDKARTMIASEAVATNAIDDTLAAAMHSACDSAPDGHACLVAHHYDDGVRGIAIADHSLRVQQAAVDAEEDAEHGSDWFAGAMPCMAKTLIEGVQLALAADITISEKAHGVLSIVEFFAEQCRPPATATGEGHSP